MNAQYININMSSEQIIIERVDAGNGATSAILERMNAEEYHQPITWTIDRIGDRNINPYSINSVAHATILDYLSNTNSNNIIYNDYNQYNINVYDVPPTIPIAEVVVDSEMEIIEEEKDCCVCQEDRANTDICRLNCMHTFCCECVKNVMDRQKKCPLCRVEISQIYTQNEENKMKICNSV